MLPRTGPWPRLAYCLLFLLGAAGIATAQPDAPAGRVIADSSGQPLPYATVVLTELASGRTHPRLSDAAGAFPYPALAPGARYAIAVTYLGYRTYADTLRAGAPPAPVRLVAAGPATLAGVTVAARRRAVATRLDGYDYHVSADPTAAGLPAGELVRRAPLVSTDARGSLRVAGRGRVAVYVNGRRSPLVDAGDAETLNRLSAAGIERIEVLTDPPAGYDGGSDAVINIVTRQRPPRGTSAEASLDCGSLTQHASGQVARAGERLGLRLFASGNLGRYRLAGGSDLRYLPAATALLTQDNRGHATTNQYGAGLVASLQAGPRHRWTATANHFGGALVSDYAATTRLDLPPAGPQDLRRQTTIANRSHGLSGSLDYAGRAAAGVNSWTAHARLTQGLTRQHYAFTEQRPAADTPARTENDNPVRQTTGVLRADYRTNLWGSQLEAGLKATAQYFGAAFAESRPARADTTGRRAGNQWVTATYCSDQIRLDRNYTLRLGLRAEYAATSDPADRRLDWLPELLLRRALGTAHGIRLTYKRAVQRPGATFRNPNVAAPDPGVSLAYAPDIRPEYSNRLALALDLRYPAWGLLRLSAYGRRARGYLARLSELTAGGLRTVTRNLDRRTDYGAGLYASTHWNERLSLSGDLDVSHATVRFAGRRNAGWSWAGNLSARYTLSARLSTELGGTFLAPRAHAQGWESSYYAYRLTAQWSSKSGRLRYRLSVDNPLTPSFAWTTELRGRDFAWSDRNYFFNRGIRLGLSWRMGNWERVRAKAGPRQPTTEEADFREVGAGPQEQNSLTQ